MKECMKECEIIFANTHCKKTFPDIFAMTLQERMYGDETSYVQSLCWHLSWNHFFKMKSFCNHTFHTLRKVISWYTYFDFAWKNVCRWNLINAISVKWHLRWNKFCKNTLQTIKKAFPAFLSLTLHERMFADETL